MRRRTVVPLLTLLEDRTTPAGFVPGTVQGQDGWSGGSVDISTSVTQGVNQGNGLGHQGTGALVVSNSTANGNFNGGFSGWPFGPALSVAAGQPSSGAAADLFTATVWFRTVATVADGSNIEIDLGTADGTDRNSFIGFANYADADGGLRLYFSEPNGNTGTLYGYEYGSTLSRGVWHRLDITSQFRDGSANDTLTLTIDGVPFINPATNVPEIGTLEGYFEGTDSPYTYRQTNRLMLRSGFKPSDIVTGASDTAAAGFAFDDISYSSALSSAPNSPLATYFAAFESQPALAYFNPAWAALANGTPITDADPTLPGNQPATVGSDAFGNLSAATAAIAPGGQVLAFAGGTTGDVAVGSGITLKPGGANGTAAVSITGKLAMSSGSVFAVDLNGPAAGTQYDQLTVSGIADIGASTLLVNPASTPFSSLVFTILQAGSVVGQFAGLPEGAVVPVNGLNFKVRYTATSVVLEQDRVDVSVTITDNQSSVTAGQQVSYTVVVRNTGPRAVSGAAFTLTPPAALLNSIFGSVAAGGATGNTSGAGPISNSLTLPVGATVTYTVTGTVSPTATGTLSVTATAFSPAITYVDLDSNNNIATDTDTVIPADTTRPTATVTAPGPLVVGTPITLTITFSEAVSGFTSGDVQLTNATPGTLSGSGTTYTLTVTPTGTSVQVSLLDGAAADAAGNPSVATTANFTATVPDTTRPTATITALGPLVVGTPITLTITFSEAVTGFGAAQLAITNATLSQFSGSGATYSAVIVPTSTTVTASVPNGGGQDAAGNPSVAAVAAFAATRPVTPTIKPSPRYATAVGNTVTVFNPTDGSSRQFQAFPGFGGTVTVATGDLNGDGIPETVVGAGPGGGPHVRAFDGATGAETASFFAYDPRFTGGVFVAVGGGRIVTGAGAGGGPHVKAFNPAGGVTASFFAYDAAFTGGVRVAVGDVNNDGVADIVTAAGAGGGPHVKAFDGTSMAVVRNFFAFDTTFTNGVYVAVGNGQIFTGAGEGSLTRVKGFDRGGNVTADFTAFDAFTGGVRVAVGDVNNDGIADLVTGAGPGGGPHVKAFALPSLAMTASFFAAPLAPAANVRFGSDITATAGSPGVFVG